MKRVIFEKEKKKLKKNMLHQTIIENNLEKITDYFYQKIKQKWEFMAKTEGKIIFLQLNFEILRRNQLVEKGQNLIRETTSPLIDSEVMCATA